MPGWLISLLADLTPASAICFSIALFAASLVPFFLLINASFDPRPLLARVVASGRLDWLLIVVGPVWAAVRNAVLDAAALVLLLTTRPKGASHV